MWLAVYILLQAPASDSVILLVLMVIVMIFTPLLILLDAIYVHAIIPADDPRSGLVIADSICDSIKRRTATLRQSCTPQHTSEAERPRVRRSCKFPIWFSTTVRGCLLLLMM